MMMLFARNSWAVVIMKPSPALALICSPTTRASSEPTTLSRSPVSAEGSEPGSTMCRTSSHRDSPSTWPSSPSLGSTPRMPANVLTYIGNSAPSTTIRILGMSPMPNQTMNSGSRPSSGIDRTALSTGSKAYSPIRLRPLATASSHRDRDADREPDAPPLGRDQQRRLQRPVGRRVGHHQRVGGVRDRDGRHQAARRQHARRAEQLPQANQGQRADQPEPAAAGQEPPGPPAARSDPGGSVSRSRPREDLYEHRHLFRR